MSSTTQSDLCSGCRSALRPTDEIIACTLPECGKRFHKEICVGGSVPRFEDLPRWICPQCRCEAKRGGDNSSTPVRGATSYDSPDMNVTLRNKKKGPVPPAQKINLTVTEEASNNSLPSLDLLALTGEIRLLREEVTTFNAKLDNVSSAMASLHEQMHHLVARVTISDERIIQLEDRHIAETGMLRSQVHKLEDQLNSQAQAYLRNEVEVIGIPESPNENLQHLALVAAQKLGVDIKEEDIDWVLRAGSKRPPATSSTESISNFCRPVVIRLLRRTKRDCFLKGAKARKTITSQDLGIDAPSRRVFFNERLTRENRQLFRESRLRAAEAGYKYCWTANGCIFVRKREGSPPIRIRNPADLEARLGPNTD